MKKGLLLNALFAVSLIFAASSAQAATTGYWTNPSVNGGKWQDAANWQDGTIPNAAGDIAYITPTGTTSQLYVFVDAANTGNVITLGKLITASSNSSVGFGMRAGVLSAYTTGGFRFDNNGNGAEWELGGVRTSFLYGANPTAANRYASHIYLADNLTITAKDSVATVTLHANMTAVTEGLKTVTFADTRTGSQGWFQFPAEFDSTSPNYSSISDGSGQVKVVASGAVMGIDIATKQNTYTGGTEIRNGSTIAIAGVGSLGGENAGALTFGAGGGTLMWRSGIRPSTVNYTDSAHAYDIVVNGSGVIDLSNTNNGSLRYGHSITGNISGAGQLTFKNNVSSTAATAIQLRGDNSGFTGNVVLDKARLSAFTATAFGSGAGRVFTLKNNADLDFRASMTFDPNIVLGDWVSNVSQILAQNARVELNGVISQTGGLQYLSFYGSGATHEIVLNKSNTYTAATNLTNTLTLTANNTDKLGSATGSGQINIVSGTRLNVLGRVTGQANVAAGGEVSGNGTFGNILFAAGNTTLSASQGLIAGDVTVNGDLLINFDLSDYVSGSPVMTFNNLIKGGSSITFNITGDDGVSNYDLLSIVGTNGFAGETINVTTSSGVYNIVASASGFSIQAIPEPAHVALLLGMLAMAGLLIRRRR